MPDTLSPQRTGASGRWVVISIVLLAVILGLVGMKYRVSQDPKPATVPSTLPIAKQRIDEPVQH